MKFHQKEYDLRLETESLSVIQNVCSLLKKYSENDVSLESIVFQDYLKYYSKLDSKSTVSKFEATDQESREQAQGKNKNPFIMFDSDVSPKDFRSIKNGWIAKELRSRESEFASFFDLKVHIGTWNVNGKAPGEDLQPWLDQGDLSTMDLLILGFQEVDLSTETFIRSGASIKEEEWARSIDYFFSQSNMSFKKIASKQLVGMLILVFANEKHIDQISEITTCSVGCGILGVMGNKGGVGVRMKIYDSFITFVNSHLAADVLQVDRRNEDFFEIANRMEFPLSDAYPTFTDYTLKNPWVVTHMDIGWHITNENSNTLLASSSSQYLVGNGESLLTTPLVKTSCTVFDSDHLFWFGDLNYRIPIPDNEAKEILNEENGIQKLVSLDQLKTEMRAGRAFFDFSEHDICFKPSYKFNVGSDQYDTSEKRRAPSYCDRILWLNNQIHREKNEKWIQSAYYNSTMNMRLSDHKPILGIYMIKCRKLNPDMQMKITDQIVLDLDRFENDALPDIQVNTNVLEFGQIRFLESKVQTFILENKGKVLAKYKFISTQPKTPYCKPWCSINPPFGMLLPGDSVAIEIKIMVTSESAARLNFGRETLDDILILHTKNGKDLFIAIHGEWLFSCFGNDIDVLCRLDQSPRSITEDTLKSIHEASISLENKNRLETNKNTIKDSLFGGKKKLSIPKEVWRCVDFIYRYGMDVEDIFSSKGDLEINSYIRECLDCGMDFDLVSLLENKPELLLEDQPQSSSSLDSEIDQSSNHVFEDEIELNVDLILKSKKDSGHVLVASKKIAQKSRSQVVHSMVETLFQLLESFVDPIVPYRLHYQCVREGYHNIMAARLILQSFPESHYHLFIYLVSFFREFRATYNGNSDLTIERLAEILSPLILKSPPPNYISYPSEAFVSSNQKFSTVNGKSSHVISNASYQSVTNDATSMMDGMSLLFNSPLKGNQNLERSAKENAHYELRKRMFIMQFLDQSHQLQ